MKTRQILRLKRSISRYAVVCLVMVVSSLAVYAQDDIVLNTNGSFEASDVTVSGDTAGVEGWTFELQSGAEAEFAIVDSVVKDGSRALQINVLTPGPDDWSIQAINEPFAVEAGKQYRFSIFAKASQSGTTASFTVGNPEFSEFGRIGSENVTLDTEWQEFTFTFMPGANDTVGRAPIHFSFGANEGMSLWLDSLRITTPEEDPVFTGGMADGKPKWLGNVYSADQLDRFLNYWNQVTPENAGKWGSVEGSRDNMNWDQLDAAYNLAKNNDLPFRFHVLVWGAQQPGWMNDLEPAEQLEEIEEWFTAVAERYPDIDYLEVVNEPLHQRPDGTTGEADYWEALGAQGETGWDWVIKAFEMAREIFPEDTKLMINDYGIVSSTGSAYQYRQIIDLLIERDLLDRIGVQAHAFNNGSSSASNTTPGTMRNVLDILSETGLPIQATELDIDGLASDPGSRDSDEVQLENIKRIFPVFWEHPGVEGVTFWGWRIGMWRSNQDAMLWGDAGRPRPSLEWLEDYVDTAAVEVGVSNEDFEEELPEEFQLSQNYPNPFNPNTQISFTIPASSEVTLNVYDITGRLIQTLVDGRKSAGSHVVNFNASNLSTGIYIYELRAGMFRQVKKMTLIK